MTGTIYNILGVASLATSGEIEESRAAYPGYRSMLAELADLCGFSVEVAVGVFSALSPVNDYIGNLRSAKTLLLGVKAGLPVEEIIVSTTHRNRLNAWKIATGADIRTILRGPKVFNFYHNILYPDNPYYVTIDRHALSAWLGKRSMDGRVANYALVANDYRRAADLLGLLPNAIQAQVWFTWKRLNRIAIDDHPDFFIAGTSLRTTYDMDALPVFSRNLRKDDALKQGLAESQAVIPPVLQTSLEI